MVRRGTPWGTPRGPAVRGFDPREVDDCACAALTCVAFEYTHIIYALAQSRTKQNALVRSQSVVRNRLVGGAARVFSVHHLNARPNVADRKGDTFAPVAVCREVRRVVLNRMSVPIVSMIVSTDRHSFARSCISTCTSSEGQKEA